MEENRARTEDVRFIAMGAMAAFMYGTTIFAPFFAVPLQASWTRGGFRAFLISTAMALAGILGWLLWQFHGIDQIGFGSYLLILSVPIGLAASIAVMNSKFVFSWPFVYRTIAGGVLIASIAATSIFSLFNNPDIEAYLRKGIENMTSAMGVTSEESFSAAVLKSSLDIETILITTRKIIANSFAFIFFIFTFLGHWIGSRMAGNDVPRAKNVPRLNEFSVPLNLIWAFLGLWSAVLLTRFSFIKSLSGIDVFEAIAWNAVLTVSFCYAVQGFGILRHLMGRFALMGSLRWAGTLLVVLLLFNIVTGAWTAGILTVLGATETWIPYRISKGVQT